MHQPLVSIIISAYNAEKLLPQTLDSVLKQSWTNLEIIVVNDGSTDNTLEVAKSYIAKGIKVISQENKGQDAALNFGYSHAKGEFIKFMDSDDLINPEMIELQVNVLAGSTEYIAYGEWARFYDNNPAGADFTQLDYWKDAVPLDFLTARPEGVMLQCGIMLIPRNIIEKAGTWDERLMLFNDTEFFTRIILQSKGVKFSKGARLYYRSGRSKSISAQRSRKFFESTYLATCLIGEKMIAREDSYRVRNLISNMYQDQYYNMYPNFPDLGKKHEQMIEKYGCVSIKPQGGRFFILLNKMLGWKKAKYIQQLFYKVGYLKLISRS